MAPVKNTSIYFNEIPTDYPIPGQTLVTKEETIDLDTVELNGSCLLKVLALSIDPYLRLQMRETHIKSYFPAYEVGQVIYGLGIAVVLRSEREGFKAGDKVYGLLLHQEYHVALPDILTPLQVLPPGLPISNAAMLGVGGLAGGSGYMGYKEYAKPKKGQTIFVSTAAGAVGSVVVQLAKRDGLKVIGSAGSEEKVAYMKEIGVDVAFNYKTTDTNAVLAKEGPIDIYWENVGGATLDAALANMQVHGTIIVCGVMSSYNGVEYAHKNLSSIFAKSLHIHGFLYTDLAPKYTEEFYRDFVPLVATGAIKHNEEVTRGLDKVGEAMERLQKGENTGKVVVWVADE